MNTTLTLTGTKSTAVTYQFVGAGSGYRGWALCTVNDATGELLITSDWGNWSHCWNPRHLGCPSLTAFIGGREHREGSGDYLAMKLLGRDEAYTFDPEATVAAIREVILQRRRNSEIDRDDARCAWDIVGAIASDCNDDVTLFLERCYHADDLDPIGIDRLFDFVRTERSRAYRDLTMIILPALVVACAATTRSRGEIGADHG